MKRSFYRSALLPGVAFTLVLAGCAGRDFEPAPAANEISARGEAAIDRVEGVQVVTQMEAWPGAPDVETHVTPVRVQIENRGDQPLLIRYDRFALVSPDGERFSVLPPFSIEGAVTDYQPVARPEFLNAGTFLVPEHYGPLFPTLGVDDSFHYDPLYYDRYHGYWRMMPLPTQEMLQRAIPEGVLEPGGEIAGFLYFEKVEPDAARVTFRADLVDREGDVFGEIRIPYEVSG